jgi:(p)ppGpp synthase/HD superfamily hydrolase
VEFDRFNNKERIELRRKEIEEYNEKRKARLAAKSTSSLENTIASLQSGDISDVLSALRTGDISADELYNRISHQLASDEITNYDWNP